MTTNARKTDAQRLGNGKKAFNVKQVEKMVEGAGGTEYTAGAGISISSENAISVDTTTIQEKLTAGDNITIVDNVISALGGEFEIVENDKYAECVTTDPNNVQIMIPNEDLIFVLYINNHIDIMLLPKGSKLYYSSLINDYAGNSYNRILMYGGDLLEWYKVFTSSKSFTYNLVTNTISTTTAQELITIKCESNSYTVQKKNTYPNYSPQQNQSIWCVLLKRKV